MIENSKPSWTGPKQRAKEESMNAILSAAAKVLSRHGYAGTTISRVAEAAGVSRGLLHYHFKNKEEMLAKVLRVNMEKNVDVAGTFLPDAPSAESFTDTLIFSLRSLFEANSEYLGLFLEGLTTARHSDVVRRELGDLYGSFRTALKERLGEMERTGIISPAISPDGLAALITGMLDGMGIQLVTIPGFADDEMHWRYLRAGIVALLTADRGSG